MGIVLAEIFYPGYNVSSNFISDLGAFCRTQGGQYICQINQPSSTIFNGCSFIFGVLVLLGSYFAYRTFKNRLFTILIVLTGIGITGVGIFPENVLGGLPHHIVSQMIIIFGGLSAIAAYRIERSPMSYFSVIMGAVTLFFLGFSRVGVSRAYERDCVKQLPRIRSWRNRENSGVPTAVVGGRFRWLFNGIFTS
jgi:hypothetical membrane protein